MTRKQKKWVKTRKWILFLNKLEEETKHIDNRSTIWAFLFIPEMRSYNEIFPKILLVELLFLNCLFMLFVHSFVNIPNIHL
jgi:hypothetical protein